VALSRVVVLFLRAVSVKGTVRAANQVGRRQVVAPFLRAVSVKGTVRYNDLLCLRGHRLVVVLFLRAGLVKGTVRSSSSHRFRRKN